MKKLVLVFVSLFIIVITAQNVNAQYDESATAGAFATIITPIEINKTTDLSFGNIISSAAEGEVTVSTAGVRNPTGGATFPTDDGDITSAVFNVTGFAGSVYSISLPADNAITLTGIGDAMSLKGFTHNANEKLDAEGKETFNVGATLIVNGNQAAGEYEGSFPVIVNYN